MILSVEAAEPKCNPNLSICNLCNIRAQIEVSQQTS